MNVLVTGNAIFFLKEIDCLILSGKNEEATMDRKVEKAFLALNSHYLGFLQQVEMSWARTKLEIEVEENDSFVFQFLNHPKYPQPS